MADEVEPIEIAVGGPVVERAYEHQAFGQIRASRVSGKTTLYGSDFLHHNFVEITVSRSQLNRTLSHDWHFAKNELIEVRLSEAQWATFVSSMNVGMGVPCTLSRVVGTRMPDIPLRKQEDEVRRELKDALAKAAQSVADSIKEVEGELGKQVSAKMKGRVLEGLRSAHRKLSDSLPYTAAQFEKHMENTVEKAKIEVNAYVEQSVMRAGLQALGGSAPLQLQSGTPEEKAG